jgi:hypothetical protein
MIINERYKIWFATSLLISVVLVQSCGVDKPDELYWLKAITRNIDYNLHVKAYTFR